MHSQFEAAALLLLATTATVFSPLISWHLYLCLLLAILDCRLCQRGFSV